MRNLVFYIEAAQLLAAGGVPAIEVPLVRHLHTLPDRDFRALRQFLRNPTHLRTCAREARAWEASAVSLRGSNSTDLPLLMLSARKNALPGWDTLQQDLAKLSPRATHMTLPEMSHISMLANCEHAQSVVAGIREFLKPLL